MLKIRTVLSMIVGASTLVAGSSIAASATDEVVTAWEGAPYMFLSLSWQNCYVTCPGFTKDIGPCLTSQECCGYYDCVTGNSQLACCAPGKCDRAALQASPPVARCL